MQTERLSLPSVLLKVRHRMGYKTIGQYLNQCLVLEIGPHTGDNRTDASYRKLITMDIEDNPNLSLRGDGCMLPFRAACFDAVILLQVIEHVDEPENLLQEARRVLRSNGLIALTTPNRCYRIPEGKQPWNPDHKREYTWLELSQLLERFGVFNVYGVYGKGWPHLVEMRRVSQVAVDCYGVSDTFYMPSNQLMSKYVAPYLKTISNDIEKELWNMPEDECFGLTEPGSDAEFGLDLLAVGRI